MLFELKKGYILVSCTALSDSQYHYYSTHYWSVKKLNSKFHQTKKYSAKLKSLNGLYSMTNLLQYVVPQSDKYLVNCDLRLLLR